MTQPEHLHETNISTALDAIQCDFEDFKRFSHAEILSLKAQIALKSNEIPKQTSKDRIEVVQEALIRSLHEVIFSLERQLPGKQEVIRKLLENSFEKPLRTAATSSEVRAPVRSTATLQPELNKEPSKKSKNSSIAKSNNQKSTESTGIEISAANKKIWMKAAMEKVTINKNRKE